MIGYDVNKDWILENIRNFMKEKGTKVENLSSSIGISKGELSKILNGERKDYYKYLPEIANQLNVSFLQLVHPMNGNSFTNYGTINDSGVGLANIVEQKDESIKKLLNEKDIVIDTKNELISLLKKDLEKLENKYGLLKQKLNSLETQ